jgi:hypothetical protein
MSAKTRTEIDDEVRAAYKDACREASRLAASIREKAEEELAWVETGGPLNWGDVGDMQRIATALRQAKDVYE